MKTILLSFFLLLASSVVATSADPVQMRLGIFGVVAGLLGIVLPTLSALVTLLR